MRRSSSASCSRSHVMRQPRVRGKPFTEHRHVPDLRPDPADARMEWGAGGLVTGASF
jgi:hypothetical protein